MVFPNNATVKGAAAQQLRQQPNSTRLIFVHTGVPAAVSLVLSLISYLLSLQIADTGGLGGMDMRSLLETLQSMLQIISSVFSVFWAYGYIRVLLNWSAGTRAWGSDLLAGFHRWGVVLRSALLQLLIYIGAMILAMQMASVVFAMTPLADSMMPLVEQIMSDPTFMPTEEQLLDAVVYYLPFMAVAMLALMLPVFYRLRLMDFVLMDEPKKGAFYAMRMSILLMRKNAWKMFRLDLSFWWFYLLEGLAALCYYSDMVLQLAGVDLGLSRDGLFFLACVLGLVAQTALYVGCRNRVMLAYANVYTDLKKQLHDQLQQPSAI